MTTNTHFPSYLAQFSLEWEIFSEKSCRENWKKHFVFYNGFFFFFKSCRLWYNVDKCCRAGQATDHNKGHAHYMLDT